MGTGTLSPNVTWGQALCHLSNVKPQNKRLIMNEMNYIAKVFSDEKYLLGESPFYDPRTKTVSWVDIIAGKFYTQKITSEHFSDNNSEHLSCHNIADHSIEYSMIPDVYELHQQIGAAVPMANTGDYLIAGTDGLYILSTSATQEGNQVITKVLSLTDTFEPYQRSNDAKADPKGRLWFGSSVLDDHEPCGNLYMLQGSTPVIKQPDTLISNGMAWNKACNKFYFSDSLYHAVFVYDYDNETGNIANRRTLFEVENGIPDGMCIDSEDNLWVAIWGGHRIEKRSSIDGSLLATITVDAKNVTSCCFIGNALDTLIITTSGNDETGENDGKLFICKVDTTGLYPDVMTYTL